MNLWLRLLCYLAGARWRPSLRLPAEASLLHFRVLPNDLDTSLHMNNGRYLTIMDLGRLDLLVSSSLWRAVLRHRWTPIASAIAIRFRRELRTFECYRLETRLLAWDASSVVIEQVFVIETGPRAGQIAARALFKGGLYDRAARNFVPIARLMQELGLSVQSPPMSPEVEAFLKADDALRQTSAPNAA